MKYEDFKKIFNEEGVDNERVIEEKWKITQLFMDTDELDEKTLRWSINEYMPDLVRRPPGPKH